MMLAPYCASTFKGGALENWHAEKELLPACRAAGLKKLISAKRLTGRFGPTAKVDVQSLLQRVDLIHT